MRTAFPRSLHTLLIASLLAGMALGIAPVRPAQAAPFTVTKTADTADGACDADCSLREAIIAANASAGADTITVPAGTYTLILDGIGEDAATTGDLDITEDLTLTGAGAATTIVDASSKDRAFHITGAFAVSITGITVRNGSANEGGGLYVGAGATVAIQDSTFSDNTATGAGGGAIRNTSGSDKAVSITNSTFSGNTASATNFGGGAIYSTAGTVTVSGSTFTNNTASGNGGGAISTNLDFGLPTLEIFNSTFSGNQATLYDGGAISSNGDLSISGSTFSGNTAVDEGGGVAHINGNAAITNSTFSGNSAGTDGGGIHYRDDMGLTLNNVTIVNNTADSDNNASGNGGGVYQLTGAGVALDLSNTIIAGNSDLSGQAPDCYTDDPAEPLNSLGYNLVQNITGCSFALATGDKTGQNPNLGALANNGGSTQTHALLSGSPAIDAGSDAVCAAAPVSNASQNGVMRPADGDGNGTAACDIGSYEAPAVAPPAPTATPTTPPPAPPPWATPVGGKAIGSAGGEFDCGEWVFTFAAGSVPDGSTLHCGPYDPAFAPGAPGGFSLLRKTVNVHVYDSQGHRQTSFNPPFTACYARSGYRDADVLAAGGSAGNFAVLTGEIGGAYAPLTTTVDTAIRRACGTSNHLSLFELAARVPYSLPATGAAFPPALGWGAGLLALAGAAGWASRRRKARGG